MDPYDPCSQSGNFTQLLNSQQGSVPFIPSSVEPVPHFSSQVRDSEVCEVRRERRKWTPKEDIVLCSSWLNTSKDAVIANEQKHNAFWFRVCEYFNHSPNLAGYANREPMHCKQRWQKINEGVSKFVGCYSVASRQQSSGQNEADVMRVAYDIYFQDNKSKFNLEHCWIELKNDQKWCSISTAKGVEASKKRKMDDSGSSFTAGESEEVETRPIGVKASKAKARKSGAKEDSLGSDSNSLLAFQGLWSIKKEDTAAKERMCKGKILDSLLTKTEPLTDLEITLKDKLINEMLAN